MTDFSVVRFQVPMRSIFLLLLMFAVFTGCKSGDEAPQETSPLVSLLGLNLVTGYGWTGRLTSQTCSADTIQSTYVSCPVFNELESQTVAAVPNNATLVMQLYNNRLSGQFTLILPHYNFIPTNLYQITTSMTTEQGYDTGSGAVTTVRQAFSNTVPYTVTYTTQSTNTTQVDLLDFAATQDPNYLSGSMKLKFTQPSNAAAGQIIATYGFKFDKLF